MISTTEYGFLKPEDTDSADLKVFVGENMDLIETALEVKQPKPSSVLAIPTTTPTHLGQMAVDGTNGRTYIAEGVTSTDWKRLATTLYVDVADNFIINDILSSLSFWSGTQIEYDNIVTKSNSTIYYIIG